MKSKNLETLSRATNLNQEEVKSIVLEVQENHRRLIACKGPHEFEVDLEACRKSLMQSYRCRLCDGVVNGSAHVWYQRGLAHGAK